MGRRWSARARGLAAKAQYPRGDPDPMLERKRLSCARAGTGPRAAARRDRGGLGEPEVHELVEVIAGVHARGGHHLDRAHRARVRAVVSRLARHQRGRMLMDAAPDEVMASAEVQRVYLGIDVQ